MKISSQLMQGAADRACNILKSMANRHRLLILCQLVERERSVGELAEFLGIRDSSVSQHLALLRRDGLVVPRRDGQTIWYAIASPETRVVLSALYDAFCMPKPARKPSATCKTTARRRRRFAEGQ